MSSQLCSVVLTVFYGPQPQDDKDFSFNINDHNLKMSSPHPEKVPHLKK